jgi:hypothetical protein
VESGQLTTDDVKEAQQLLAKLAKKKTDRGSKQP